MTTSGNWQWSWSPSLVRIALFSMASPNIDPLSAGLSVYRWCRLPLEQLALESKLPDPAGVTVRELVALCRRWGRRGFLLGGEGPSQPTDQGG